MHPTRNDLPVKVCKEMVTLLNARLADAIDRCMQSRQAHWKTTSRPCFPLNLSQDRAHLTRLIQALATFGEAVRAAIDRADQLGDKGTADLFTEVSREADKSLWLVEAHLQK